MGVCEPLSLSNYLILSFSFLSSCVHCHFQSLCLSDTICPLNGCSLVFADRFWQEFNHMSAKCSFRTFVPFLARVLEQLRPALDKYSSEWLCVVPDRYLNMFWRYFVDLKCDTKIVSFSKNHSLHHVFEICFICCCWPFRCLTKAI